MEGLTQGTENFFNFKEKEQEMFKNNTINLSITKKYLVTFISGVFTTTERI